jgi:replication factor A1
MNKRDIILVDDSGYSVRLTLWGDEATRFNGTGSPVLACKGARVSDFHGTYLRNPSTTQRLTNCGW